jgi:hypothetical protein
MHLNNVVWTLAKSEISDHPQRLAFFPYEEDIQVAVVMKAVETGKHSQFFTVIMM